jgi:hypothetical protein
VPVHERLCEEPPGPLGGVERGDCVLRVARERLLADDVLSRLEHTDRPLAVERVRERDVDGVDVRVPEQRLVGAVGALDLPSPRVLVRSRPVAARDRDQVDLRGSMSAGDDEPVDVGRREDAEAHHPHDASVAGRRAVSRMRCPRGLVRQKRTTSATSSAVTIPPSTSGVLP